MVSRGNTCTCIGKGRGGEGEGLAVGVYVHVHNVIILSFIKGDIFGGWLHGIQTVLPDYSDEIHKTLLFSLSPDTKPELMIPGPLILSRLLPYHLSSPQAFLLMIGLLLGTPVTEVMA